MKRFKKVLVYIPPDHQGQEDSVQRALELARRNDAEVCLATAVDESDLQRADDAVSSLKLGALIQEHLRRTLTDAAEPLAKAGIPVSTKLLIGSPVVALIKEVIAGGHHLVMKTAQPGEASSVRFGSIAIRLMRQCPCPVWISQPGRGDKLRHVMAAVNPGGDDQSKDELNRKVLELAHSIADNAGAKLHVAHAWSAYGEGLLRSRVSGEELEAYVGSSQRSAETRLSKLMETILPAGHETQVHLLKGNAGDVVPRLAADEQIDLLVMGTVARSGISGLLMGNTAEKTVSRVKCSLLTAKPDGFVPSIHD